MESEQGYYFITRSPLLAYIISLLYVNMYYTMYRFEKGGHAKGGIQANPTLGGKTFALSETCTWLELLLAALDCYNWVLEEQLVAPSEVFMCEFISCTCTCMWHIGYFMLRI